jgi:SHO1 osmosensor
MIVPSRMFQSIPIAASSVLSFVGWILYFIGICVLQSQTKGTPNPYGLSWFYLFYFLAMIIGFVYLIASDSVQEHRQTFLTFLASGFVFLVLTMDKYLILAQTLDNVFTVNALGVRVAVVDQTAKTGSGFTVAGAILMVFPWMYWMIIMGQCASESVAPKKEQPRNNHAGATTSTLNISVVGENMPEGAPEKSSSKEGINRNNVTVVCKAKALYSYAANPADPTELTFEKGDVLDVLDNKGKWWHCTKFNADGTSVSGIAPSNYLSVE